MEFECTTIAAAYTTECGQIEIGEIAALTWHLTFIEKLAGLVGQSEEPKISVSLFKPKEVSGVTMTIVPLNISDLEKIRSLKTFLFRLDLAHSETDIAKSYPKLLRMITVVQTVLERLHKTIGLTMDSRLVIINSNTASIALTLKATV